MPLDFGGHMFLELDYLAGPGGLGVQGVIGDCPAALMDWSRSLQWCAVLSRPQADYDTTLRPAAKKHARGSTITNSFLGVGSQSHSRPTHATA